jgi:molybdate/tungstate transport system substrate-binding protein
MVHVVFAGSLELVNNQYLGPAFEKAKHIRYQGQGGGSYGMAHEIASGSVSANVFESIGYGPVQDLGRSGNPWALAVASSPLVLAYNDHTPYAAQLNQIRSGKKPFRDLFRILTRPGFKLGRTNPNTDPQGQAFVMAMELAQKLYHLPRGMPKQILGSTTGGSEIYTEEGILSLLQSGGLDASSAFLSEAIQRHLNYIVFPPKLNFSDPKDSGWYRQAHVRLSNGSIVYGTPLAIDVTAVGHPPSSQAISFIKFLISAKGQSLLRKEGYTVFPPFVLGQAKALPHAFGKELNHAL